MISKLLVDDIDTVMDIWLKANIECHSFIDKHYWIEHFEHIKEMIYESDNIYIYEEDDKIVGFIGLDGNCIEGLFVKKEYRNKGIGRKLLNNIKLKHDYLTLKVYKKNTLSYNFYLKNNFEIVDEKINEDTNEIEVTMEYKREE